MVEVRPYVDDEDHNNEYAPAGEGTEASGKTALVKQEPDTDGADYLREPVDEVVEGSRADGEQRAIVVVKLCGAFERWFRVELGL